MKKTLKRILSATLLLALMLALFACGNSSTTTPSTSAPSTSAPSTSIPDTPSKPAKKTQVTIGTSQTSGSYYMCGAAFAQVINANDELIELNVEATGSTNENLELVHAGEAEFGMGMCDDVYAAYTGTREYTGRGAFDELRICMGGYDQPFMIAVLASSDYYTLADLKGAKISCGPQGAPYFVPRMLQLAEGWVENVDYDCQHMSHAQACDSLVNGDIDCIIAAVGIPNATYASLTETYDIRFIGLTDEEMDKVLTGNTAWMDGGFPSGTYKGIDSFLRMPSIPIWIFTSADLDEDVVYHFVKNIAENKDELALSTVYAAEFNIDNAYKGVNMPMHPGAEKYYKEIGIYKEIKLG